MTWNYRVVVDERGEFGIHEVYYNDKAEITNVTVDAIAPVGETLDALRDEMERYAKALLRPVLKMSEIKCAPRRDDEA